MNPSTSLSTPSSSNSAVHRVAAPKNIARLGRSNLTTSSPSTSTLGEPIKISEFKVPSLPDRRPSPSGGSTTTTRRPLTMSRHSHTNDISEPNTISSANTATPNRLKRLSLLARTPTLESHDASSIEPRHTKSPLGLGYGDENDNGVDRRARSRTNTDESTGSGSGSGGAGMGSGTPRRMGIRSSISYSPNSSTHVSGTGRTITQDRSSVYGVIEPRRSMDSSEGRELVGLFEEEEGVKGETLVERHAELLTAIAQKERRVNELKQELQTEQAALNTLKSRWSTLISNIYPTSSSHTTPMQTTSSRDRAQSPSDITSSSISSQSDSGSTSETQQGFQSLLQDVLGGAPLVDPDVMEGGRRFIGNLMKTVGAAAGGTVPVPGPGESSASEKKDSTVAAAGLDLSSLRGMFSWTTTTAQPTTVRIRPSDSGSSIKERDRRSPQSATSTDTNSGFVRKGESFRDLLSD